MYSMVLMAALTTATDMPDFGRRGGCHGCYGGWGCHGCRGGWGGCYGGCYGCYGGGGWGGCYGGYGCGGCYGGWGGGCGGWGGGGGGGYVYAPTVSTYAAPVMLASTLSPASTGTARALYYSPTTSANNRATIIVQVPDDATLMVNGNRTTSVSTTRRFYTPPLEPGTSYHYDFEAIVKRDGHSVKATKGVDVVAGETRVVAIPVPDVNQTSERQPPPQSGERDGLPKRRVGVDSR